MTLVPLSVHLYIVPSLGTMTGLCRMTGEYQSEVSGYTEPTCSSDLSFPELRDQTLTLLCCCAVTAVEASGRCSSSTDILAKPINGYISDQEVS